MNSTLSFILSLVFTVSLTSCTGQVQNTDNVKPTEVGEVAVTETETENADVAQSEERTESAMLANVYYKLAHDKELSAVYIGGSITYGQGASVYDNNWVARTTKWLGDSFSDAKVNELNVGISNTGSNYAVFRLDSEVLSKTTPDLVFLEFTSNDWGRFGEENISRQTESIIRRLYEVNPYVDIVFVYTSLGAPTSNVRKASDALAKHYNLLSIDVGGATKAKVESDLGGDYTTLTKDKLHPTDDGYALYLDVIKDAMGEYLIDNPPKEAEYNKVMIPEPFNKSGLFMNPKMLDIDEFPIPEGFTKVASKVGMGRTTVYEHYIETKTPGAEYEFSFSGTGFGLLVYKCEDVSDIEYSVDGSEYIKYQIGEMHYYNHGQMYICEYTLPDTEHTVRIRNVASPAKTRKKDGETLRIIKICVNESENKAD